MSIKGAGAHQSLYFGTSASNKEIGRPILQDNWTESASFQVYKFPEKQSKYHVNYIYFYNIKFTKYMKFTKFTALLYKNTVNINFLYDNKVDLMCMHWVHQYADSSFYNAIQEF